MIRRFERFIDQSSQFFFFLFLSSISLIVYGFRGAGYKKDVTGDDLDLFVQALNRTRATSGIAKFDVFGLFDPYNGYLGVLLRVFARFALIGPDTQFTFNAYVLMTLLFAVATAFTCTLIGAKTSRKFGLLALIFCIFLPFSNLVILAQLNTVAWPLALLMIVATALQSYPTTVWGKILTVTLFAFTAMSSGTVIIVLAFLVLNLMQDYRKINKYEFVLLCITALAFLVQWHSFTPRTNPKLPLNGELHKSLFNFSPQFIREKIGTPLNGEEQIIFWVIPIILLIIWLTQANQLRKHNWPLSFSAIKLFLGGFILLCLLIRGNGWFNTHYLFIPTSMFWISLVLLFYGNRDSGSTRLAITISGVLFAVTYSGTYYLL